MTTSPEILLSQSSAADWYDQGQQAQSIDEKIQAFGNVIRLDPTYIEAYYYLGLAYKMKGELAKAEIALNKAYFKNPYALNNEIKTNILYELGTLYSSLGKLDEAKDALQGAKELSVDKTSKRKACYELGQIYIKVGNYDKALNELNEGIALLPPNAELFEKAINLAEEKKSINDKYNTANSLLISERYDEAIKLLEDVLKMDANFKQAQQKLQEAKDAVQQINKYKRLNALYEQATTELNNGSVNDAIILFEQIVNVDPDYKDVSRLIQRAEAQLENNKIKQSEQNAEQDKEEIRAEKSGVTKRSEQASPENVTKIPTVKEVSDDSNNLAVKIEEVYRDG
ncbi:MAG: tetratricopeptide repeat protein, partial [bacterium]